MTNISNISSIFPRNSEAFASELRVNIEEIFSLYYMHSDIYLTRLTTHKCVTNSIIIPKCSTHDKRLYTLTINFIISLADIEPQVQYTKKCLNQCILIADVIVLPNSQISFAWRF